MNIKSIGIGVGIVLVGVFFLFLGQNDDEKQIHERLDELIELAEKEGSEPQLTLLTKARKMSQYFVENPRVEFLPGSAAIDERDSLIGFFVGARKAASEISIGASHRNLVVDEGGEQAVLVFTGKARVVVGGSSDRHSQRLRMAFRKESGEWLISELQKVE